MRYWLGMLLCGFVVCSPAWAAEKDIVAEFTGCDFRRGKTECLFIGADNMEYWLGSEEGFSDDPYYESLCERFPAINDKNIGFQFIITPEKVEYYKSLGDDEFAIVEAKTVKVNKRKNAPRNTKVLAKKILGKISCVGEAGEEAPVLIDIHGNEYTFVLDHVELAQTNELCMRSQWSVDDPIFTEVREYRGKILLWASPKQFYSQGPYR